MILNSGLDSACDTSPYPGSGSSGSEAYPSFCGWLEYAAIGTGSTEPTAADTSLDAQVGNRSNDRGGFSNTEDAGVDVGSGLLWYESTFVRVINITGNVNAAEWGLATGATSALSVRDLFRSDPNDPGSDPIVLTLEDGDQLQLIVTLRVQANWEYETKSFIITGTAGNDTNGTHTGQATLTSGSSQTQSGIRSALYAAWPKGQMAGGRLGSLAAFDTDKSGVLINENMGTPAANVAIVEESYVPGTFYRDCTATFITGAANFDHYAWMVSAGTVTQQAYRFILTDPPYLTKQSTHRLTLTFRKSIARL